VSQYQHIHGAEILVENFAVSIDQNGMGNRRIPGWIYNRTAIGRTDSHDVLPACVIDR
jgi:hypothetical protein